MTILGNRSLPTVMQFLGYAMRLLSELAMIQSPFVIFSNQFKFAYSPSAPPSQRRAWPLPQSAGSF